MTDTVQNISLTGENFIPGLSPGRHEDDHLARYRYAVRHVKNLKVLDIACGPGYGARMLADAGAREVVGVDISPRMIDFAKATYGTEGARFVEGSIYDFQDGSPYDFITSFETIEHVPDYENAISNLFSLLKPGGTLLVSSPDRRITSPKAKHLTDKPDNTFHTQEFTVLELMALLQAAGFIVQDVLGQRQQILFRWTLARRLYRMIVKPHEKTSPELTPLKSGRVPRYFVVQAIKPPVA